MQDNPTTQSNNKIIKLDPIKLLQKLVQCKSITPLDNGIIQLVTHTLSELGFTCEIIEFGTSEYSNSTNVLTNTDYKVKNIYATIGKGSNTLAFCGHLDVVPPGDETSWNAPPFAATIVNNSIIGRGVEDMKGAIACFMAAVSRVLPTLDLENNQIIFLLTLDEESLAINGIQKLIKHVAANQPIQACILGEPTGITTLGDCIKVGRRGSLNFNITINGVQGHVAYPHLFSNPITIASKILNNLLTLDFSTTAPHFEPTNLEITGVNSSSAVCNIVPAKITIKGNVRFNPAYNLVDLKQLIIKATTDFNNVTIEFAADASEPFIGKLPNCLTTSLQQAIKNITQKETITNTTGGTSDARFLKNYIPQVIEFGLVEKTLHQVNENVSLDDLATLTNIYSNFLEIYFNHPQ